MIPSQTPAVTPPVGEVSTHLSKAKRRRLRKKRLHQGPREDGGEACAELPPDTELVTNAAHVQAVGKVIPEPKPQTVLGSIKITPLAEEKNTQNKLSRSPRKVLALNKEEEKEEVPKVNELKNNFVKSEVIKKEILKSNEPSCKSETIINKVESLNKQEVFEVNKSVEMADKSANMSSKSPQKSKLPNTDNKKQGQTRSPKVSLSKDETSVNTKKAQKSETPKKDSPVKPVAQSKVTPQAPPASEKAAEKPALVNIADSQGEVPAEKTREEVMAERKAKKAEKAAKKGKGGTENVKPPQGASSAAPAVKVQSQPPEEAPVVQSTAPKPETVSKPPSTPETPTVTAKAEDKSKAALKEERRLKQEAQRAAKATATASKKQEPSVEIKKALVVKEAAKEAKVVVKVKSSKPQTNLGKLLSHLQRDGSQPSSLGVHPAIIKLGLQFSQHLVAGSNARAVALMRAMKKVVEDYETPPQSELRRDLEHRMQTYMEYLERCRPVSVSMSNAMRDLKNHLQQLPATLSDKEAKKVLIAAIDGQGKEDGFMDKLNLDCLSVSVNVLEKIKDEDIILTYGCSSLVQRVLVEAQREGRRFRVVVVGARPWREAEKMLRHLTAQGLRCTYLLISAVSSVMRDVSKVLLGAHAILANGYVMSRAGSSQVALIAHSLNVPVIVCCETYKFCDRVQTDAFVHNELGDPDALVPGLQMANLTQCVLAYDVTPPELVSTVVTEVSMLPCSSVPVVLHMQSSETRLRRRKAEPAKA